MVTNKEAKGARTEIRLQQESGSPQIRVTAVGRGSEVMNYTSFKKPSLFSGHPPCPLAPQGMPGHHGKETGKASFPVFLPFSLSLPPAPQEVRIRLP